MLNLNRYLGKVSPVALSTLVLMGSSLAQTRDELNKAHDRFIQEMAQCQSAGFSGDISACTKEARNSYTEFKRGRMQEESPASQWEINALLRCDVHAGEDKLACIARIRGEGRTEGSVSGGGILRELVTTVTISRQ